MYIYIYVCVHIYIYICISVKLTLENFDQSRVAVEPSAFVPTLLRLHDHLRTSVHDTRRGWTALELESSINEHVPDATGKWCVKGGLCCYVTCV